MSFTHVFTVYTTQMLFFLPVSLILPETLVSVSLLVTRNHVLSVTTQNCFDYTIFTSGSRFVVCFQLDSWLGCQVVDRTFNRRLFRMLSQRNVCQPGWPVVLTTQLNFFLLLFFCGFNQLSLALGLSNIWLRAFVVTWLEASTRFRVQSFRF